MTSWAPADTFLLPGILSNEAWYWPRCSLACGAEFPGETRCQAMPNRVFVKALPTGEAWWPLGVSGACFHTLDAGWEGENLGAFRRIVNGSS